tara:strand:- start:435 stop:554 length:120 start_codon:yes stop_codon:yes gene_type:complete
MMKNKFKIILPWLIKAYLCYSIVSETIVIGGVIYLIFFN